MPTPRSTRTRIFITGGASGLGRALAERYARAGWSVLVGDIDQGRLDDTVAALRAAGSDAHGLRCDVRQVADLEAARDFVLGTWGGVDVVVNNAGVAVAGGIAETSLEDWGWIVDINLMGVVRGCKVFTPLFVGQGHGHFVNIASMAGLVHPPFMSAYCATKAAVVAISESIAVELAPHHIDVSVVCPAFFRTNLHTTLRTADARFTASTGRLVGQARRGADEIAARVFEGVARRESHILTHPEGRVAWFAKRLAPFSAYRKLMEKSAAVLIGKS